MPRAVRFYRAANMRPVIFWQASPLPVPPPFTVTSFRLLP
jgi:hypothetical protein